MGRANRGSPGAGLQVPMQRLEHVMTDPGVAASLDAEDARRTDDSLLAIDRVDETAPSTARPGLLHGVAIEDSLRRAHHQRGRDDDASPGAGGLCRMPGRFVRADARPRNTHLGASAVARPPEGMITVGGDGHLPGCRDDTGERGNDEDAGGRAVFDGGGRDAARADLRVDVLTVQLACGAP